MTRHEFFALVVVSPLAILLGKRKQEEDCGGDVIAHAYKLG